jgi:toxin FitB
VSGFLLDTNVISELVRRQPDPRVVAWVTGTDETLFFLSVLTLGEIRKGIAGVSDGTRRVKLEAWLDGELAVRFSGRVLPIDAAIADRWGRLSGMMALKSSLPVVDGLLAATAMHHNLTLVTRNVKDVAGTGVDVFNPWTF